jgi:hypothetical protein
MEAMSPKGGIGLSARQARLVKKYPAGDFVAGQCDSIGSLLRGILLLKDYSACAD